MSLNPKQFMLALERAHKMDKRLVDLIGFNPTISNHYGMIYLYNKKIDEYTTDKEILSIRERYLAWKKGVLDIFLERGVKPSERVLDKIFNISPMYGTMYFLGKIVEIDSGAEPYRELIMDYIDNNYYRCD